MGANDPDAIPDARELASRLLAAWQSDRRVEDLRGAVDLLRKAATTTTVPSERMASRADLSAALQCLYEVESDSVEAAVRYLDEAIAASRGLVGELPDGSIRRRQLANLANALRLRHDATSDARAVLDGVTAARLSLDSGDSAEVSSRRASNLALLLRARFIRFGDVGDVNEAVNLLRNAVHVSQSEIRHLVVSNLADTLAVRGYRLQQEADLLEAVRLAMGTLDEDQPHDRGGLLTNAGLAALDLYRLTNNQEHVRDAVSMLAAAADEHTPAVELSARLGNLSMARRLAFTASGDLGDLDAAVSSARDSLDHAVQPKDRIQSAATLARALWARFEVTAAAADADESIEWRTQVARSASATPSDRLDSARVAGDSSTRLGRHRAAAAMYSLALDLAMVLGILGIDRRSQELETARLSGLATNAAAAALATGDAGQALFEVDRGRAILWAGLRGLHARLPALELEGQTDPRPDLVSFTYGRGHADNRGPS